MARENKRREALTCIPSAYTVSGTPGPEYTESEALMIRNFLNTLAEVSMAIASRKAEEA